MPYTLRLLCLCLASFSLLYLALSTLTFLFARRVLRATESMRPADAARLLFWFCAAPTAFSGSMVLFVCIPSYLRYESHAGLEQVGTFCFMFAILGVLLCGRAALRTFSALLQTAALSKRCRSIIFHGSRKIFLADEALETAPSCALVGVFRPRLLLSAKTLHLLTREQLDAAIAHEDAHQHSHDNLKRLVLLATPEIPFAKKFFPLRSAWMRQIEMAADDEAMADGVGRSVALAEALLRVARCASVPPTPLTSGLSTANQELAVRVERLLASKTLLPVQSGWTALPALTATLLLPILLSALCGLPAVHRLSEWLIH